MKYLCSSIALSVVALLLCSGCIMTQQQSYLNNRCNGQVVLTTGCTNNLDACGVGVRCFDHSQPGTKPWDLQ